MNNYAYEVICADDKGWGTSDNLWGEAYIDRADRIFPTAAEARAACRSLRNAGCWDDDVPSFGTEKISVYEALWLDTEEDEAVIDRLIDIHGGSIQFCDMPRPVAGFLLRKYGETRDAWQRESAVLAGASSATTTAAAISARFGSRCAEIREMLAQRQ